MAGMMKRQLINSERFMNTHQNFDVDMTDPVMPYLQALSYL